MSLRVTLYANGETSVLFYRLRKVSDDDRIVVGFQTLVIIYGTETVFYLF